MKAKCITPILNVSDMESSFEWFMKLGWSKNWEWGDPAGFGCVGSGECEIFLCLNGQGGRGKSQNLTTFQKTGDELGDGGTWMSVWVEDVDQIFHIAKENGIEVTCEPEDMPWGVRECHIRHPDGHVFRISSSITTN
ncbi:bleomycin resistance family protein [Synechocystis sp. PCC 7339]|uniref:bleomycin resistance family protein n=1 Tax=unclassified Synechocystis TaxID=2640012 RepID=UPI001BAFFC0C|nr:MULTISPECIES: bleomycin resistance family protein [unclassified Synechocystis]QUS59532.1 bleomycin resistance family protein [Synechocystis sp. PCC 7338]UAJ71717.1 bleomycin resistance family protein [Synechocystis sp. PCC 7339]